MLPLENKTQYTESRKKLYNGNMRAEHKNSKI
jgi:hypothetical protein